MGLCIYSVFVILYMPKPPFGGVRIGLDIELYVRFRIGGGKLFFRPDPDVPNESWSTESGGRALVALAFHGRELIGISVRTQSNLPAHKI